MLFYIENHLKSKVILNDIDKNEKYLCSAHLNVATTIKLH